MFGVICGACGVHTCMDLLHLVAADVGVADVAFSLAQSCHALFYSALDRPALPCFALPCPALL